MKIIIAAIAALPLEQQSEWREIHETPSHAKLELDWRTLPRWTPEHREAVAVALHDYALSQSDARNVLREITRTDRRIGVWLSCAVARTALRYVPANEDRPRLALEAAERWVRGEATGIDCGAAAAAAAAADARDAASVDVVYACSAARAAAASAAATAASNARDAASDAASYAATATAAAADAYTAWHAARTRFLRELCQTIATAARDAIDAAAAGYDASEA